MSCYRAIKNVDSEYDCPTFLKITIVKHSGSATSLSKPNTFYYLCLRVLIHPILLIIVFNELLHLPSKTTILFYKFRHVLTNIIIFNRFQ